MPPSGQQNNERNNREELINTLQEAIGNGQIPREFTVPDINEFAPFERLEHNHIADSIFSYRTTMEQATPETPRKFPKKQLEINKLVELAQAILRENPANLRRETSADGDRAQQYESMLQREKMENTTVRELVSTDRPIHLRNISYSRRMEIANAGVSNDFDRNGVVWCNQCGFNGHDGVLFLLDGSVYCSGHLPHLIFCEGCQCMQHDCELLRQYDLKEVNLCSGCRADRSHCSNCERKLKSDHLFVQMCDSCMDEQSTDGMSRGFSLSLKWVGPTLGKIMQSPRIFSTELEGYGKTGNIRTRLIEGLPKEAGVSGDGSLGHNGNEFEVQTPRLAGARGEEFVERICATVKEQQGFITERCGMHIHLDGAGIILPDRRAYPVALLQLWKAHIVFEDVLLSFLPFSRRTNKYCAPFSTIFKVKEIEMLDSLLEAEKLWYKRRTYREINNEKRVQYHPSRYFGINFHPLFGHGHMEVRYHSGTFIAQKVLEWANLHALIMDAAVQQRFSPKFLTNAQVSSIAEKTEMLFEVIGLSESSRKFYWARQKKFSKKQELEGEEVAQPQRADRRNGVTNDITLEAIRRAHVRMGRTPNGIWAETSQNMRRIISDNNED